MAECMYNIVFVGNFEVTENRAKKEKKKIQKISCHLRGKQEAAVVVVVLLQLVMLMALVIDYRVQKF